MADSNSTPAAFPNRIGPWTLTDRVGAGGMGVVYRATRPDLGDRLAALKVIRPGMLDDPAIHARFAREVDVLRRVRDVHISEFIDADLDSDPAWLATAFIPGANLRDHIAAHGPLQGDAWWELARGLSQSLAVLEVHGITHRDLKPANVILAEHGPVLIDFGIAMPEDAASLTATGLVTGSPAWLSPEQVNLQPVTGASDVFSLGSLLAFAGTGRPPFGAGAQVAVLLAIATRDLDTGGLSHTQQRLLRAMTAKDPAARPTPRTLLQWTRNPEVELSGQASATVVLRPEPVEALDATVVDRPLTAPVPAQAADPVPPLAGPATAPAAPVPAEPAPAKRRWPPLLLAIALIAAIGLGVWWVSGRDGEGLLEPNDGSTPPASTGPTPSAPPAGTSASSGTWSMSSWSIQNNADGTMSVKGTIKNNGTATASGTATAYIYADGQPIGSATGELTDVPAGGSVEVTLVGTDPWQAGAKSIALEVT